jgi:hypothetical protein
MRAKDGFELIEGVIFYRNKHARKYINAPATIPFRALVPEKVDGLLVVCAVSATNVAFSALRMEPAWMATGQAAGVAAALAVSHRTQVRGVDSGELQKILASQGQVLAYFKDLSLEDPKFAAIQLRAVAEDYPSFRSAPLKQGL